MVQGLGFRVATTLEFRGKGVSGHRGKPTAQDPSCCPTEPCLGSYESYAMQRDRKMNTQVAVGPQHCLTVVRNPKPELRTYRNKVLESLAGRCSRRELIPSIVESISQKTQYPLSQEYSEIPNKQTFLS